MSGIDWKSICWHLIASQKLLLAAFEAELGRAAQTQPGIQPDRTPAADAPAAETAGSKEEPQPKEKEKEQDLLEIYDDYNADLSFLTQQFMLQGHSYEVAKAMAESEIQKKIY